MGKKYLIFAVTAALAITLGLIFYFERAGEISTLGGIFPAFSFDLSPEPSGTGTPSILPSPTPTLPRPQKTLKPVSTPYPWFTLPGEAVCELRGELKFLNSQTYDNQDALFTYSGVDHPGRVINWMVAPNENLSIGPNLFASLAIPDGRSLIGVVLPPNPVAKRFELTAAITYGRLVEGNIKVFDKQCLGKTTVVLP